MEQAEISRWAAYLDTGLREGRELDRISSSIGEFAVADAYRIQAEGLRLREARGERQVGLKMGLTSRAKREQMNLHSPVYGSLTDRMAVANGRFPLKGSIHPKIEPEIAFRVARELRGPVTREEALAACDGVAAALEILDSRYIGFKYFSLPDVIADNSSSSYFAVGPFLGDFSKLSLERLNMKMSVNGKVAQQAISAEISGDPVISLVQLCELLAAEKRALPAGSIVLAGAATTAVPLEPGLEVRLEVDHLEPLTVTAI